MLRNFMDFSRGHRGTRASIRVTSSLFLFSVLCFGLASAQTDAQRVVHAVYLGRKSYAAGLKVQEFVMNHIKTSPDQPNGVIIMVEHDPVYTVGMRDQEYGDSFEFRFRALGADFFRTNRGGLITFHGPGQLVVYPILHLNRLNINLKSYITLLEEVVVATCANFGVQASTTPEYRGVWVDDRKICAIGIHVSQNVTSHGLALECETNLKWYDSITPCGIADKGVTTLSAECKKRIRIEDVKDIFNEHFGESFNCRVEQAPQEFFKEIHAISSAR